MSLNWYTDKKYVPEGMKIVDYNDIFFNTHTSLINDDFTRKVLKEVDKAEYQSEETFLSRTKEFGALFKKNLSTGTKTLLNVHRHKDICFDLLECGDECLELLKYLGSGNVLWSGVISVVDENTSCDIILNNQHKFTNFEDLIDFITGRGDEE